MRGKGLLDISRAEPREHGVRGGDQGVEAAVRTAVDEFVDPPAARAAGQQFGSRVGDGHRVEVSHAGGGYEHGATLAPGACGRAPRYREGTEPGHGIRPLSRV